MSSKHLIIAVLSFCACNSEMNNSNNQEEGVTEIVEVYEETPMLDVYDSIQDKWTCNHEGTFEELCKIHDIDPYDTHLWIFKNIKK